MEKNNIIENKKEENRFRDILREMGSYNDSNNFQGLYKKIPDLIKFMKEIIAYTKKKLIKIDHSNDIIRIDQQIKEFYDKFFRVFKDNYNDLFSYLFEETRDIYRKRVYQLNHFHGYLSKNHNLKEFLDKNIDFNLYLQLNLFVDYYESFAIFLRPFIYKIYKDLERDRYIKDDYNTGLIYQFIFPQFFKIRNYDNFFDDKLRNELAHSSYYLNYNDHSLNLYNKRIWREKKKKNDISKDFFELDQGKIEKKYYNLSYFVIWFTTYFDIRINSIFLNQKNKNINKFWSIYFEDYINSWKEYQKL